MKNLSYLFVLVLSISIFQSCAKEDQDNEVAPNLPPVESFIMPFDGFEDADTTGMMPNDGSGANERTPTFHNWFYSATNVVVWNTILTVNLAIPVASFYGAFDNDAQFQGNGVWLWSYDFQGPAGINYTANLYGELVPGQQVNWEMFISQEGGFVDVLWYSGTTATDGSYAQWTLNHQPNNLQPMIGVEYNKDNGNGMESIRYTNIIPGNAGNGGYIEFRTTDDQTVDYNKAYDIFKAETDNLLEINWNKPNNNGRVKDEEKFGDTDWHCWDVNLQDTEC